MQTIQPSNLIPSLGIQTYCISIIIVLWFRTYILFIGIGSKASFQNLISFVKFQNETIDIKLFECLLTAIFKFSCNPNCLYNYKNKVIFELSLTFLWIIQYRCRHVVFFAAVVCHCLILGCFFFQFPSLMCAPYVFQIFPSSNYHTFVLA